MDAVMENLLKKMESDSNFFIDQMNAAHNLFAGFVKYKLVIISISCLNPSSTL